MPDQSPNLSQNRSTGVLLTNLGTPDAPTASAVRRYLDEFLWDPRVIEMSRPLWWLILHCVVLRIRPRLSATAYRTIWTEAGSPLLVGLKKQARALASVANSGVEVAIGMRYGKPSIASGLETLNRAGVEQILVLPLYPQYSATTTASTFDAIAKAFETWRRVPSLRFISDYHDEAGYIEALSSCIRRVWSQREPAERLLFSFHGIPQRYANAGDPYYQQCLETVRLVTESLGLSEDSWQLAFQSRVGREVWLQPYTDQVLQSWGKEGIKSVDVVCPGFSSDCLETLEEIDQRYRGLFEASGGSQFHYIPALNDDPVHIRFLQDLIQRHL